jgi:hypothetical protein
MAKQKHTTKRDKILKEEALWVWEDLKTSQIIHQHPYLNSELLKSLNAYIQNLQSHNLTSIEW